MEQNFVIEAQSRQDKGKGASRRLRREGVIPGIVYGGKTEPQSLNLSHNQIWHAAQKEAFYSHILDLSVDGKIEKVVVKDMQRHPFKPLITHVDFLRVSADQKLKTHIPLHCVNEEICVGAKAGGLIMHDMIEVEISCLPKDLPEFIQVDVAALNIGDSLHLSQLPIPAGVELTELVRGHDQAVVSVVKVRGADKEEGEETEESAE